MGYASGRRICAFLLGDQRNGLGPAVACRLAIEKRDARVDVDAIKRLLILKWRRLRLVRDWFFLDEAQAGRVHGRLLIPPSYAPLKSTSQFCIPLPMAPTKSTPSSKSAPSSNAIHSLWQAYNDQTTDRLKFVDAFLVFIMLSGALQFMYCVLITNFPFNAFLAGCVPISRNCIIA